MPFDGGQNTPALNRALLIEALRRQMPDGFTFNYSFTLKPERCGTCGCAMGLAAVMGIVNFPDTIRMATALGIRNDQSVDIFYNPKTYGFQDDDHGWEKVTPQMVADALEHL